ncbi:Tn3 family transposase, partial [Escherichia coli]|nr:Tn3 family transposase [Escherichia coli]
SLIKQVLRAYIFCGACGNNRTNRGGFQFAAARLPWFILDWLQSVELRRRVHAGLNKGEARNSLARAVFFNRL